MARQHFAETLHRGTKAYFATVASRIQTAETGLDERRQGDELRGW